MAKNSPNKRSIVVTGRFMHQLTHKALLALVQHNDPPAVFVHGDVLARVRPGTRTVLERLSQPALKGLLDRVAAWLVISKGKARPTRPPQDVVSDILAMVSWPDFPIIEGVVRAPVVAEDGTIHRKKGYSPTTRVFLDLPRGSRVPAVSARPTRNQIEAAVTLITGELLGDFPFASEADRANAIALLLQPFARRLIDGGTPLFLVEAPTPGTGKGLLVEVLLSPSQGRDVPIMSADRGDDELRKGLTAKFAAGSDVVFFDNVTARLDSGVLAAALTAPVWEDRWLGVSRMVRYPVRCTWVATGNNPQLSTEIARRTVRIRLTADRERAWERTDFKHPDLAGWAQEHRGELIGAALTLIRAWLAADRPGGSQRSVGRFESWSEVMGGILDVAGVEGFLGNRDDFYERADTEAMALGQFISEWDTLHGTNLVGAADLYDIADSYNGRLFDLGTGSEQSRRVKLGYGLQKIIDRRSSGYRIEYAGTKQGAARYRLVAEDAP